MKTEATKKTYRYMLSGFLKFYHIKDFDSLLKIDHSRLQEMLEDYLFHIKKIKSPATVQTAFYAIELFFSMNDMVLNFKKLRKMFPPLEKKTGMKAYTTEDIQQMLVTCTTRKQRAMILVLSSSGMRVGGLAELKMKHISEMPHDCRAITVYPDSRDEYTTFITPEACATLDDYFDERKKKGERFDENTPMFRADFNRSGLGKAKHLTEIACTATVNRVAKRAKTTREKQTSTRYNIQGAHGLRKRFNTILKSNNEVNSNLAERLMGHSQTIQLDNSYLDPKIERLFEEYQKVIPELSIDDAVRLKIQNEQQKKKISDYESSKERRIEELESRMDTINKHLQELKKD